MLPLGERALHGLVVELAVLHVARVAGVPTEPERPELLSDPDLTAILDAANTTIDPEPLPGRGQPLERKGASVPGEDLLGRGREDAAGLEGRAGHPLFGDCPALWMAAT